MRRAFLLMALVVVFSVLEFAQSNTSRLLPVKVNYKVGYIDSTGKIVIQPQYDAGWKFSEGFACVVVDGKTGFINESGTYLIKPQFSSDYGCYTEFSDGVAPVSIDDYRQINGKMVNKSKWGFVNTKGNVMFFPGVIFLSEFSEGLAFFRKGSLVGYMDRNFNTVIKLKFKDAGNFHEGRARVTGLDGSKYYIDKNGRRLFNFDGCDFQNGIACYKVNDKWGYIDLNGQMVIKAGFDQGNYFGDNGLAAVKVGKKWGFINRQGEFVIGPQFDDATEFREGLASVEVNGKRGFINKRGEMVIAPLFDKWIYWFENGISEGRIENKIGYIDKSGKFIWRPTQ